MTRRNTLSVVLLLVFTTISKAQSCYIIGWQVSSLSKSPLEEWAVDYSKAHQLANSITVPDFTHGPVFGIEWYLGSFNTGINFNWNRRIISTGSRVTPQLETINLKLKIKYHTFEFPFFFFPKEGLVGIGGTCDFGVHKVTVYDETQRSGPLALDALQIGTKLGLKFRTSDEKTCLSGMIYYQTGIFTGNIDGYAIKPNQIGLRLCLLLYGND